MRVYLPTFLHTDGWTEAFLAFLRDGIATFSNEVYAGQVTEDCCCASLYISSSSSFSSSLTHHAERTGGKLPRCRDVGPTLAHPRGEQVRVTPRPPSSHSTASPVALEGRNGMNTMSRVLPRARALGMSFPLSPSPSVTS